MAGAIKIGLAGLGTVGAGVVRALRRNRALVTEQAGGPIEIARVAERDASRFRALRIPAACRTGDTGALIDDPEIRIVVELIGGTGVAKDVALGALRAGKHLVTANKALLAKHWRQVFSLAHKQGCAVGFESSVMAGVPVVRSLERGLAGNAVASVLGILNGTTNFVLTRMAERGEEFPAALAEARRRGMCEADARLDTDGYDAAQKLSILASIALGRWLPPGRVFREGIGHIEQADIVEARDQFGYVLRPLAIFKAHADGVEARVHPTLVPRTHPLATVAHEFNAVLINGDASGPITLMGKGAGEGPAASGVVGDIIEIARALTRHEGGGVPASFKPGGGTARVIPVADLTSKFYVRFSVIDEPGVLSLISGVLGKTWNSTRSR